jgi:bifunctional non-homologous end joining protein LigD
MSSRESNEESDTKYLTIDDRRIKLTNLGKILYPASDFTKADVIDYYARIGPIMLPYLENRPLTLKRYPNGVDEEFFYEKHCPKYHPQWVETARVQGENKAINFCMVNDLPSLVWTANLASLELHTSLSLSKEISRPTMMVFDLDPGAPATLLQCVEIALKLRDVLEDLGLKSFPKTSGGKGLHLYVPLNTPVTYDETKSLAHAIARLMEKRHERLVTSNMRKDLRNGKVFVDWSQNDDHKTTVCAYSLRARARPTVSAPLEWKECEKALKSEDASKLVFEAPAMLKRIKRKGDVFEPVAKLKQKLPEI